MQLLKKSCQTMANQNDSNQKKILLVDDDLALRSLICRFLIYHNYEVKTASDAKTARQIFKDTQPELVILDINLPDDTGLNLCQEMHQHNAAVVMLTSMEDSSYILKAFEKGADDYITKPFNLEILKARVDAVIRRNNGSSFSLNNANTIIHDNLKIDLSRRLVIVNNQKIALTALEFDLLYFLASNPNQVWDRAKLISAIWNKNDYDGEDRKVDIHIGRIRKKIDDLEGKFIKTIWGRGYMFEIPTSDTLELAD
ncbi:response regulator transcription factor [Myxosarcina sp. GI1]|uniref:response regulator transcription factor n=1 Tax=Myxosarcina sp. GI1 TaxID=1541065 RepID=UPI0005673AC6|nr:response regulator transcription factor [Myxosarcina sp. GI1]